jgi:hypothetical protein
LIQYDYGTLKNREMLPFRPGSIPTGKAKNVLEYGLNSKIKDKIKTSLPECRG